MNDLVQFYETTDFSIKFNKLERNDKTRLTFGNSEYLYLGLHKPFFKFWVQIDSSSKEAETPVDFTVNYEIYINGAWVALDVIDETFDFSQSGFISFDMENWKPSLIPIHPIEKNWIRLTLAPVVVDETPYIDMVGANLIFNDDLELETEIRNITDYLYRDREGNIDKSFIKYHVSTRDDIVQALIVGGYLKKLGEIERFNKWDIIDFEAIRVPCKYHTLAKIFLDNSTNVDDKNYIRGMYYMDKYGESFRVYALGLDSDSDGKLKDSEFSIGSVDLVRI